MKIFVSYSRSDAGDFAEQIQKHFRNFKNYDVFTDVNNINAGEDWSDAIEKNIAKCDIFVIIITYGSLQSTHVRDEILQAQRENKRIIPCFHKDVGKRDITWGLSKIQGVEFTDKYELARDLYTKVQESKENVPPINPYPPRFKGPTKKKPTSKLKIVVLVIGVVAVIAALIVLTNPPTSRTSPETRNTIVLTNPPTPRTFPPETASGYDHGCDDAKISDPSDRDINQPETGPTYHSEEFMRAYNEGYKDCELFR